jgi:hypothetical protein
MEVVRLATAEEFLAATETYRLADPTRTDVLSSVPTAVVNRGVTDKLIAFDSCVTWAEELNNVERFSL